MTMPFTLGFTCGLFSGIALMVGFWRWLDARMDADDRRTDGYDE